MNLPLDSDLDFLCCLSTFSPSSIFRSFFLSFKYGFMFCRIVLRFFCLFFFL